MIYLRLSLGRHEHENIFELLRLPRVGTPVSIKYGFHYPTLDLGPYTGLIGIYSGYDMCELTAAAHFRPNGFERLFKRKLARRLKALKKLYVQD